MTPPAKRPEPERGPSGHEEFDTQLQELRVLMPGVQVLFAFLLTIPFSQRFTEIDGALQRVYFVAFISAALATIAIVAPTAYHRLRWREADREDVLHNTNRFALVAVGFLALAVSASVYLVTELTFSTPPAAVATALIAATIVVVWFGLPVWHRARGGDVRRSREKRAA